MSTDMSTDPFVSRWPHQPVERYGLATHEYFRPVRARKQHHCRFARHPQVRSADCTGWIEPGQVYVAEQITDRERVPFCTPCALANFPRLVLAGAQCQPTPDHAGAQALRVAGEQAVTDQNTSRDGNRVSVAAAPLSVQVGDVVEIPGYGHRRVGRHGEFEPADPSAVVVAVTSVGSVFDLLHVGYMLVEEDEADPDGHGRYPCLTLLALGD